MTHKLIMPTPDSLENAAIANDYPWGFKMKTTQHYWVEFRPNMGWRAVYSTVDPRNGKMCAPKKGTYSAWPIYIGINPENQHIEFIHTPISVYMIEPVRIQEFVNNYWDQIDENNKRNIKGLMTAYAAKYPDRQAVIFPE
jgi:hypothetical protein